MELLNCKKQERWVMGGKGEREEERRRRSGRRKSGKWGRVEGEKIRTLSMSNDRVILSTTAVAHGWRRRRKRREEGDELRNADEWSVGCVPFSATFILGLLSLSLSLIPTSTYASLSLSLSLY